MIHLQTIAFLHKQTNENSNKLLNSITLLDYAYFGELQQYVRKNSFCTYSGLFQKFVLHMLRWGILVWYCQNFRVKVQESHHRLGDWLIDTSLKICDLLKCSVGQYRQVTFDRLHFIMSGRWFYLFMLNKALFKCTNHI